MDAVLWNERTPQYCKNLVNKFLQFNGDFSYNTVSGGTNGVANNNQERVYEGEKSLLVTFTGTGEYKFNTGGTETQIEIPKDGQYLFSYAFWKDNDDATIDVGLQFYVNGIAFANNLLEQSLHSDNGFINGQWNTYYQFLNLLEGDLITLDWTVQTDDFSGTKLYMDGLMYNLNDRNLTIPPIYQVPETPPLTQFSFDYNNAGSGQSYTTGELLLQNDGAGTFTNTDFIPVIHADIYDTTTDTFDWNSLELGDAVLLRLDLKVETTGVNQVINSYLELGQGVSPYRIYFHSSMFFKDIGTYDHLTVECRITMLNNTTLQNPAQFKFNSDDNATVTVNGVNATVLTTT